MGDGTIWRDEGLDLLDEDECLRLLGTVPVGRVGICAGALPAILPVNFELRGRSIVFRTGRGTKLDAAVRSAVVAFQADQYDSLYHTGWSVLAVGQAVDISETLDLDAGDATVRPWAGGERQHYVAIDVEFVSGRRISHDR
jgi:hypothetical protein